MFLLASLLYWNQEIFKGSESYRATYAKLDITWNKMVGYGSCSIVDLIQMCLLFLYACR